MLREVHECKILWTSETKDITLGRIVVEQSIDRDVRAGRMYIGIVRHNSTDRSSKTGCKRDWQISKEREVTEGLMHRRLDPHNGPSRDAAH